MCQKSFKSLYICTSAVSVIYSIHSSNMWTCMTFSCPLFTHILLYLVKSKDPLNVDQWLLALNYFLFLLSWISNSKGKKPKLWARKTSWTVISLVIFPFTCSSGSASDSISKCYTLCHQRIKWLRLSDCVIYSQKWLQHAATSALGSNENYTEHNFCFHLSFVQIKLAWIMMRSHKRHYWLYLQTLFIHGVHMCRLRSRAMPTDWRSKKVNSDVHMCTLHHSIVACCVCLSLSSFLCEKWS